MTFLPKVSHGNYQTTQTLAKFVGFSLQKDSKALLLKTAEMKLEWSERLPPFQLTVPEGAR